MFKIKVNKRNSDGVIVTRDFITAITITINYTEKELKYTAYNGYTHTIKFNECDEIYIDDKIYIDGTLNLKG